MADSDRAERCVPEVLRDAGDDDSDVYVVGVRESADSESWSLLFMEPYDMDDEQEVAMGMDTYCLVVDPGQATFYGGVIDCAISDNRLHLALSAPAAQELGTPTEMTFSLMLTPDQLRVLRRGLTRVLTSGRRDTFPRRLAV
ncbi:MAG: Imm10 family immunity protein [Micromonosporaceae bacterium]